MSERSARRRMWTARIATAGALWVMVVGIAAVQGNHPDALLIALTLAAFATTLWLYLDASVHGGGPDWDRVDDDPVRPPGEDSRLAFLSRILGQHLDGREVADTLHRQLEDLAEQRLMARHGVSWRVDPEQAAPLLGPELLALARQRPPYPRLDVRQIDVLLSRIEAL
jgi:hypothetical protein